MCMGNKLIQYSAAQIQNVGMVLAQKKYREKQY